MVEIMNTFHISNITSGAYLGSYSAETEAEALDALARDSGYTDYAEACTVSPSKEGEILVEPDENGPFIALDDDPCMHVFIDRNNPAAPVRFCYDNGWDDEPIMQSTPYQTADMPMDDQAAARMIFDYVELE